MRIEEGELVVTGAELAAAPAVLDLPVGALARLPRVTSGASEEAAVRTFFDAARKEVAALWRGMIATLADPARIGVLHYALGEESVTRLVLAWGPATADRAVVMASRGDGWAISSVTADALTETIAAVLLAEVPLKPLSLRIAMSQEAATVLMAALHKLRAGRLRALLEHEVTPVAFTAGGVAEAIENAVIDDFRWPFTFFDKVLPFSPAGIDWSRSIPRALTELGRHGLIEAVGKTGETFALTRRSYPLMVADAQHLTKLGLRVTAEAGAETRGHEAIYLQRSLQDLLLVDLGGREAVIASIPMADLKVLVRAVLTPPEAALAPRPAPRPADATGMPGPRAATRCPSCGGAVVAGARFCGQCGQTLDIGSATCAGCGTALGPGAKFCPACGAPTRGSV